MQNAKCSVVGCVPLKAHSEFKSQDVLKAKQLKNWMERKKKDRSEEVVHDQVPSIAWDDLMGISGANVARESWPSMEQNAKNVSHPTTSHSVGVASPWRTDSWVKGPAVEKVFARAASCQLSLQLAHEGPRKVRWGRVWVLTIYLSVFILYYVDSVCFLCFKYVIIANVSN